MRPIKFRAWCKEERKMYDYAEFCDMYSYIERPTLEDWLENEFTIPMQFTGLLDCNGKEIFEGDIVRNAPNNDIQGQSEVFFGNGCYEPFHYLGLSSSCFEIIGNIYENPELLEEQDDKRTANGA